MTRETKISLLVGLAFIIVIGILLSDHFRSMGEPPQAALTDAGEMVRRAVNAPGTANPPITIVAPAEAPPSQSVPTHDELAVAPSPVIPSSHYSNKPNNSELSQKPAVLPQEDHGADVSPDRSLTNLAQRNGEPLVPANIDGSPRNDDSNAPNPPVAAVGPKQYKAQSGDTLSGMAAKLMGSNSRANRQAIIDANTSLQDDPDKVIAGQTYVIPARGQSTANSAVSNANSTPDTAMNDRAGNTTEYFYTVQEGDSLWQIANDEVGDPDAVAAIKELNKSILKGENHETVIPGMKLRLPSKPVASAAN